ncbi:MAG: hypothetical protein AAGB10_12260 [Pseudomonadota bacterium]
MLDAATLHRPKHFPSLLIRLLLRLNRLRPNSASSAVALQVLQHGVVSYRIGQQPLELGIPAYSRSHPTKLNSFMPAGSDLRVQSML